MDCGGCHSKLSAEPGAWTLSPVIVNFRWPHFFGTGRAHLAFVFARKHSHGLLGAVALSNHGQPFPACAASVYLGRPHLCQYAGSSAPKPIVHRHLWFWAKGQYLGSGLSLQLLHGPHRRQRGDHLGTGWFDVALALEGGLFGI